MHYAFLLQLSILCHICAWLSSKAMRSVTKMLLYSVMLYVGVFVGAQSANAAPVSMLSAITAIQFEVKESAQYVRFSLDTSLHHKRFFTLENPSRVVVDMPALHNRATHLPDFPKGNIKQVRFGQFDGDTTRIVIELIQAPRATNIHYFTGSKGLELVVEVNMAIDTLPPGLRGVKPRPAPQKSATYIEDKKEVIIPANAIPRRKPDSTIVAQGRSTATVTTHTMKRSKGLPLIVIDPGHGGKDPGATQHHVIEKHITLNIARALSAALTRTGRYRAQLTRTDDRFISLDERVRIAQQAGAWLFISLHADAASVPQARGVSVYTVSETASDAESERLAAQENSADYIGGVTIDHNDPIVADILLDLTTRDNRLKSTKLADFMIAGFTNQRLRLLSNPHRYAGFRVLKAPNIPSVLIEMGFLTNPHDIRNLQDPYFQQRFIQGVVHGVDRFYSALKK